MLIKCTNIGQCKIDKLRAATLVFMFFGISGVTYAAPIDFLPLIDAITYAFSSVFIVAIVVIMLILLSISFSRANNKQEWIQKKGIALLVFVPLTNTVILVHIYG